MTPRIWPAGAALGVATLVLAITPVEAQMRGLPVQPESHFASTLRTSLEVGHRGEVDGLALAVSVAYLVGAQNCHRFGFSAGGGILNPEGGGFQTRLSVGGMISVLMLPCGAGFANPPNPAIWGIVGVGLVRSEANNLYNVPLGLSVIHEWEVGGVRLAPWFSLLAQYRDSLHTSHRSLWGLELSAGLMLGWRSKIALSIGATCCEDGIGVGYRLSHWRL